MLKHLDMVKTNNKITSTINNGISTETPEDVLPTNTTAVSDGQSIKPVGSSLTDKMLSDATTKEEVDISIAAGNEVSNDAKLNKNLDDGISSLISLETGIDESEITPEEKNIGGLAILNQAAGEMHRSPIVNKDDVLSLTPEEKMEYEAYINNRKKSNNSSAFPALEALGVQDYYPDINQSINVGSISSSMLGSRNRYVAQGGLVPQTVLDARARALEKKAALEKKEIDDLKNKRFITAQQYQQQFDDKYFDFLDEHIQAVGGDVGVLTDPTNKIGRNFMRKMNQIENSYKSTLDVDNILKAAQKDYTTNNKYVPQTQLDLWNRWSSGLGTSFDDIVSGNDNVHKFGSSIKVYENARTLADEKLKELESESNVIPLNMNIDWSDPKMALNAKEAIKRKSGQSHDQYMSATRTYFDTSRIETIADMMLSNDNMYRGMNDSEQGQIKSDLVSYMMASLADKIEFKSDQVSHNRANEALDRDKFNWEKYKYNQDKSFYQMINDNISGQEAKQKYIDIMNKYSDPEQRKRALQTLMANNGNFSQSLTNRLGFTVSEVLPSESQKNELQFKTFGQVNIGGFKGKERTLKDYEEMKNGNPNNISKEEISYWDGKVGEMYNRVRNQGHVAYYVSQTAVTPATIWNDNGRTRLAPGEYMDVSGIDRGDKKLITMGIDLFDEYVIIEPELDDKGRPTGNNKEVRHKHNNTFSTSYNLSDEGVIASKDAIDLKQSKAAETGESHRDGGGLDSYSKSTSK